MPLATLTPIKNKIEVDFIAVFYEAASWHIVPFDTSTPERNIP